MLTVALTLADTLPAASFAQAYAVLMPDPPNVNVAGADAVHPEDDAKGGDDDSVIRYPVTALSGSVTVKEPTLTVGDVEEAGSVNDVIVGAVVSARVVADTGAD